MNCSGYDPSSSLVTVRQGIKITYCLVSVLFLLMCAHPMIKMARERIALYLLVSKLVPGLLSPACAILQLQLLYYLIPIDARDFVGTINDNCVKFSLISVRLHIIALAVNRAHALFFPFNYTQKITKNIIWAQSLCMHLVSIILTPFYAYYYDYLRAYVLVSSLCYVAIALRLAWIKAYNRNLGTDQSSDKDSARITVLCLGIQIYSCCVLAITAAQNTNWYTDFTNCDDHPIGKALSFLIQLFTSLYFVSDEILLMALCKELRESLVRMLGKVLPSSIWKRNERKTTTVPISTQYSNPIPVVNVSGALGNIHYCTVQQFRRK